MNEMSAWQIANGGMVGHTPGGTSTNILILTLRSMHVQFRDMYCAIIYHPESLLHRDIAVQYEEVYNNMKVMTRRHLSTKMSQAHNFEVTS